MLRAIAVSGHKRSGKTSIIEGLIPEMIERGHRVGTVKHIPDADFDFDRPNTDTWRHKKSGSEKVVALTPSESVTLENKGKNLSRILLGMEELDFILLEGFKNSKNVSRLVVADDEEEAEALDDEFTVAFLGEGTGEKPVLEKESFSAIADLVEEKAVMPVGGLDCGECGYPSCKDFVLAAISGEAPKDGCVALDSPVTLHVDGNQIPLKGFVRNLISKVVDGIVSSLKEGEGDHIELEVRKNQR